MRGRSEKALNFVLSRTRAHREPPPRSPTIHRNT
jgi:hypothetical protein